MSEAFVLELGEMKDQLTRNREENDQLKNKMSQLEKRFADMVEERKSMDDRLEKRMEEETMERADEKVKFESSIRHAVDHLALDLALNVSQVLSQSTRKEEQTLELKNETSELKTRILELKDAYENGQKRHEEETTERVEKFQSDIGSAMDRLTREETETRNRFESEMKSFSRHQTTKIETLSRQLLDIETAKRKDENVIEKNQLEKSSDRVDVDEEINILKGKLAGVKIELRCLRVVFDNHVASINEDVADLKAALNAPKDERRTSDSDEIDLLQLAAELEEKCRANSMKKQSAELNNFDSKDLDAKKERNKDLESEKNEMEQEKLLDTLQIIGIRQTERENLPALVQSLARLIGTTSYDVEDISRTSRYVIEVRFNSVVSARSWIVSFHDERGPGILAYHLNPFLSDDVIRVNQKLTNYNRDLWNRLKRSSMAETYRCWVEDGKIFLRLNGQRRTIRIQSITDIPT